MSHPTLQCHICARSGGEYDYPSMPVFQEHMRSNHGLVFVFGGLWVHIKSHDRRIELGTVDEAHICLICNAAIIGGFKVYKRHMFKEHDLVKSPLLLWLNLKTHKIEYHPPKVHRLCTEASPSVCHE